MMDKFSMRLDVFGRLVEVIRRNHQWRVFYLGNEGKKRIAEDIVVPDSVSVKDVICYIADLCHEWSTTEHPNVVVLTDERKES